MEVAIYNRQGTLKRKVSPDSSSRWTEEVGTEFVVTVNFTTWEFFVLSVRRLCGDIGKTVLHKEGSTGRKKTDTQKYTYNISFYGREHDMQDLLFCRLNQGEDDLESVFAYDGTPMEMLEKLVANMNRKHRRCDVACSQAVTGDREDHQLQRPVLLGCGRRDSRCLGNRVVAGRGIPEHREMRTRRTGHARLYEGIEDGTDPE